MKTKVLFLATVALLGLGSNSMLHAQVELDANFPASQPHDATWSPSSSGYNLSWSNLSKKLALTSNTNTLTLKDNCNFGNADEVTMHLTYELDTELPDGYQIFTPKAELKNAVGGETIVNLRQARSKSHERTMDLTIDKSIVGGLENIQRIFIQSNHTGDNGGALFVTEVNFNTPQIIAQNTSQQAFSSRTTNGNVFLFENLPAGTFSGATNIDLVMSNLFDTHQNEAFQVWATTNGGDDVNITPGDGGTKWNLPGNLGCYLDKVNVNDITGIYLKPECTIGFATFDVSIRVSNGGTLIRESETKTFNARTNEAGNVTVNLFGEDQPAGTFTNADRLRLNFSDFSERNVNGGKFQLNAKLNDNTIKRIALPYSGSDGNNGQVKTLNIVSDDVSEADKANIVNFQLVQIQSSGEMNFKFTTDIIDTDLSINGDGYGIGGISANKDPYLTLYKDFGSYEFDIKHPVWAAGSADTTNISNQVFSWTDRFSNAIEYKIPSDLKDLTGAKIYIKTSAASSNSNPTIRVRIGSETDDAHRNNWFVLSNYGETIIDVDALTLNNNPLPASIKENITHIQIGGSNNVDATTGSIVIDKIAIVRDHAILGEVTPKYPLNLIKNPGYADYVNSSDWESNNTLTWTQYYGNQIYLAWPNNTDISDLTKFESIRLQSNVGTSGAASSYRLMVYYGDEVANDNNIKNYYSTTISSSDATINLATLFKNNTAAMQNVKNIAIAGDGNNGSCQFTRISLIRKNDAASFTMTPINGTDLVKFRQLNTNVSKTYATNVEYAPEFVLNDNTVITAEETFTPTANSYSEQIAHFNINEMLTDEQISQVKNVRIRITSYDDAQIDFSRIYLSDRITLEWDKYLKSTLDNSELRIPSTIENLFSKDWDTYLIPIYTEDLTDLKRITVEAVSSTKSSFDCVIVLDDEATNAEEGNIRIENGTYPNNRYDFDASSFGTVTLIKVKFKVEDSVTFNKLILYKSLPIYAEAREDLAVTDMTYYRADDNTYYNDTYHTQIADVVMGTSTPVVFGEVGATYVGRDGDIQSYYIMDSTDNFLTVDQPAENKRYDLIHTHGRKLHTFGDNSYILESNTRPSGYADLSDYSELRIWKNYTSTASTNNNDAPVRVFFVANTRDLTGYLTVDSVGTNFPLLVTERYCSVDLDEVKKLCNGKAYLIGIKGMNSSAAPTVTNVSVYKTKANYVLGGDMIEGSNAKNCITNALADVNATYIDATDVSTTNNYTLPRDPANPNCLIYTTNSHLIGKNVICNGKATGDITLSYEKDFYAPYDVDMDGHTVSYTANISDNLSTLVLPFSTTIPAATNLRVYTVYASIDEGTTYVEAHQMTPGTTLPANTPVLIRVPEGGSASTSWTFEGTSIEATPFVMKNEGFVGTYTAQRAPGSGSGYRTYNPYVKSDYDSYDWGTPELVPNRYVLQKVNGNFIFNSVNREEAGNMYKPKMKGFRCWLVSDNDLVNAAEHSTEQNNAKKSIRFIDVDATSIKCVTETPEDKTASKGIFNLQGQRLTAPQKGFNIINGKVIYNK